jgi:hypothetical protein
VLGAVLAKCQFSQQNIPVHWPGIEIGLPIKKKTWIMKCSELMAVDREKRAKFKHTVWAERRAFDC